MSSSIWLELQSLSLSERSILSGQNHLSQSLKHRVSQLEIYLSRIHSLNRSLSSSSLIQQPQQSSATLSFQQTQVVYSLVRWARKFPDQLGVVLTAIGGGNEEKIAKCVIADILEHEMQMIQCIWKTCSILKEHVLKPNSISALLIKYYLQVYGKEYLAHTLK